MRDIRVDADPDTERYSNKTAPDDIRYRAAVIDRFTLVDMIGGGGGRGSEKSYGVDCDIDDDVVGRYHGR